MSVDCPVCGNETVKFLVRDRDGRSSWLWFDQGRWQECVKHDLNAVKLVTCERRSCSGFSLRDLPLRFERFEWVPTDEAIMEKML